MKKYKYEKSHDMVLGDFSSTNKTRPIWGINKSREYKNPETDSTVTEVFYNAVLVSSSKEDRDTILNLLNGEYIARSEHQRILEKKLEVKDNEIRAMHSHISSRESQWYTMRHAATIALDLKEKIIKKLNAKIKQLEKQNVKVRDKEVELVKKAMNVLQRTNSKLRKRHKRGKN